MTRPLTALRRRLRLAWLAARYGVSVRPCPIVPGSYVIRSSRRLRPAVVDEVMRLHRREGGGERRSNGERAATA